MSLARSALWFVPNWPQTILDLPEKWNDKMSTQPATHQFLPVPCHGDLRCANILVVGDNAGNKQPFLIDYGLAQENDPLADLARTEADILLRLGSN